MQPSLVLAALSLSIYLKSSDAEMGGYGRKRALALRDMAQSALDASMNAGWIDLELGMSAWVWMFLYTFVYIDTKTLIIPVRRSSFNSRSPHIHCIPSHDANLLYKFWNQSSRLLVIAPSTRMIPVSLDLTHQLFRLFFLLLVHLAILILRFLSHPHIRSSILSFVPRQVHLRNASPAHAPKPCWDISILAPIRLPHFG